MSTATAARSAVSQHNGKHADPVEALYEDVAAIKRDIANLARHSRQTVAERASDLADRAGDTVRSARKRAESAAESVSDFAAERPLTTIALAAAGGMLIAAFIGTRCRR